VGPDGLDDEDRLTEVALDDQDLSEVVAEHVEFSGCRLTRCNLGGSDLDKLILVDVVLEHCDLANARWSDASATRLAVSSSRLTGFAGPGMSLQHTTIRDSVLDFSSFRFAKFVKVEFTDCRLQNADFVSADVSGTVYRRRVLPGPCVGCRLRRLHLGRHPRHRQSGRRHDRQLVAHRQPGGRRRDGISPRHQTRPPRRPAGRRPATLERAACRQRPSRC
jgi:hypothetical protein